MILRDYQQHAIDAIYGYLRRHDGNPCCVIPTGGGKTPVIATICRDAVKRWNGRVLVLAHVKELLEQAAEKLRVICPDVSVGVYSAGLDSRDTDQPVIVAGIQSVYQRAFELDRFDLILIDEAHLLPPDGEGMYQQFLADARLVNPKVRLIGLTATPYRMKSGMLCGPDNLLTDVCYEVGVKELIRDGYLCPLRSKAGRTKADTSGLHIRAGEFIASEVADLMDTKERVHSACREVIEVTKDRKAVIVFAASIAHAEHVREEIERLSGAACGLITGKTDAGERAELIARFKGEEVCATLFGDKQPQLKYLVNVNVLTTGFDAPNVDCVVLLRPTASPGLYYQMVGRGFRLCDGKADCLVLDYGNNIVRHGPVDAIEIRERGQGMGGGSAPAKECPECQAVMHAGITICLDCGYEFQRNGTKHDTTASSAGVVSGEITDTEHEVTDVVYKVHTKRGADEATPKTMRVDYYENYFIVASEWVCPEHDGWAREKFIGWWKTRSNDPVPRTAQHAVDIANAGGLATPERITVRQVSGERFSSVIHHVLGPIPEGVGIEEKEQEPMRWHVAEKDIPF